MSGNKDIQIIIVCQSGELEIKSCLLAASLRDVFSESIEIHFAIHENEKNKLSKSCESLIDAFNIQRHYFTSSFYNIYPIGNKISAIAQFPIGNNRVFMDSDMIVLNSFDLQTLFEKDVAVKPADRLWAVKSKEQWDELYLKFHLSPPTNHIQTTVSEEKTHPYYNAGLIAMKNRIQLGKGWKEFAEILLESPPLLVDHENTWIDQLTLPLVLTKCAFSVKLLSEKYNYPAHLRLLENNPAIIHYHTPAVIRREPILNILIVKLAEKFKDLSDLMRKSYKWFPLLSAYDTPIKKRSVPLFKIKKSHSFESRFRCQNNNFIITGIPRSGTSLITRLLDDQKQIVAINEPHEIHGFLKKQKIPVEIPVFMETLKTHILDGVPIQNKVKGSRVITDTKLVDRRKKILYAVDGPGFSVGIKNTLSFLLRLEDLTSLFSKEKLLVCLRAPGDTILSWQDSFPHLRNITINSFPVGGLNDPFITDEQKGDLLQIEQTKNKSKKRALFWSYLAQIILRNIQKISVIHYETLLQKKSEYLNALEIFRGHDFSSLSDTIILPNKKRLAFSLEEEQEIESICGPVYFELLSHLNSKA